MTEYSMVRYLLSKQKLDDRSLNGHVTSSLQAWLSRKRNGIRVLEIGAGVGTMLTRLVSRGALTNGNYVLLDADADSLSAAREHLAVWSSTHGFSTSQPRDNPSSLTLTAAEVHLDVEFAHVNMLEFEAKDAASRFDLVIANSVLDLLDLRTALTHLWRMCKPDAAYWFTLNFDGETIFLPPHPRDDVIIGAYHTTMDQRVCDGQAAGHSQTGRRLLAALRDVDAPLLAAGSSDWILFPTAGAYDGDERYFVDHILHFIETAVRPSNAVSADTLSDWLQARRAALATGQLTYIAKQLDVFGLAPDRDHGTLAFSEHESRAQ